MRKCINHPTRSAGTRSGLKKRGQCCGGPTTAVQEGNRFEPWSNTPGSFQITPANPNQPETGHVRAIYIKKNEDYGNYSADYPVTLAE